MTEEINNSNYSYMDVEFVGIRIEVPSNIPMLLFKEFGTNKYLPISIGMPEATSIMTILQNQQLSRPLTHDLFYSFLDIANYVISNLNISHVENGTFYAEVIFTEDKSKNEIKLSCRPSDGVALAIRSATPVTIQIAKELFFENCIELDADNAEDEIEQFKSFLDDISPEDFT